MRHYNDSQIQQRLLIEPKLSLSKAIQLAQGIELAKQDAAEMNKDLHSSSKPKDDAMTSELVYRFSSGKMPKDSDRKCHRCKGPHAPFKCPFKDATCHACGKRGHIQKACKTKKHTQQTRESHQPQQARGTHLVEEDDQKV